MRKKIIEEKEGAKNKMERNFSMRRKKSVFPKIMVILFVLVVIALIFYVFYPRRETTNIDTPVTARSEITLNEDSVTKIKTLYKCGHEKNEIKRTDKDIVGKTKQEVELKNPKWEITKFTPKEVSAEINLDTDCDNHYIISLVGDELFVSKTGDKDKILRKKQINTDFLTKEELDSLISGIKTDSEFEMLEIMESFAE